MKNTPIERNVIDETINEFQIVDFSKATIREVKAIASKAEAVSGVEFIKMEMGVPGLPASAVGVLGAASLKLLAPLCRRSKSGNRSAAKRNCQPVSRYQRIAGTQKRSVRLYQSIHQCRFKPGGMRTRYRLYAGNIRFVPYLQPVR